MKNTRIYDRVPVKDVRVKDPLIGTRTPQILISRKGGEYLRGDVLDANATTELAKSIHIPDIDKINDKLELTVNKDLIGLPNGVAGLDSTGNVPVNQLANISTDLFIVVSELPTEDIKEGKIYCIKDTSSTAQDNNYIEYAYINNKWEKIGEFQAEPDLSGYAKLSGATFTGNVTIASSLYTGNISTQGITKAPDNIGYLYLKGDPTLSKATKVFATDGSIADLDTKANTSDVLLKKSASGGYYIEKNSNELGLGAFATNSMCTASGEFAYAEGYNTKASGFYSHAEGCGSIASETASIWTTHAEGYFTKASGNYSHAEGTNAIASGSVSHAEGSYTTASGIHSHAEGESTIASGDYGSHSEGSYTTASGNHSHAEGDSTIASGNYSHAEGKNAIASGFCSHALGTYNVDDKNAIYSVGIGNTTTRKNAEYIYAKNNKTYSGLINDPKNGYKYLIGVGGYDGISTDNTTYKSVQEVITDLTARIEQLETKVRALEAANTPA